MYAFAQRIAKDAPCVMVVCLREDTFLRGRASGGFLTSSPLQFVFHVAAPPLDQLVRQRVRFGQHAIDKGLLPRGLRAEATTVKEVCSFVTETFLSPRSTSIELVAGLAGHNVREALESIRYTVQGWPSASVRPSATAAFVLDCLLASLGTTSAVKKLLVNCFDAEPHAPPLHGLRLRLLAYFSWAYDLAPEKPSLELTEGVLARFSSWGYPVALATNALHFLMSAGLLRAFEKTERGRPGTSPDLPIRATITAAGQVHLTKLLELPAYRTAMACVTRWYDEEAANLFVERARSSGGKDGPSIGDIVLSSGDAVFDAYIARALVREDATLSEGIAQNTWAAEVVARASRIVKTTPSAVEVERVTRVRAAPSANGVAAPRRRKPATPGQLDLVSKPRSAASLPPLKPGVRDHGTVWIPRILWALEWGFREGREALSPGDIADILSTNSDIGVPATNVARAFRDAKKAGEGHALWRISGRRYTITDAGRKLILSILSDEFT